MILNLTKRSAVIIAFLLALSGPCFAQNYIEGMRLLTVNALMQYGQQLYDRGDVKGACAVFDHVLSLDSRQPKAIEYLKQMGHAPEVSLQAVIPKQPQLKAAANKIVVIKAPYGAKVEKIDMSSIESLKAAIAAKKRSIAQLHAEIKRLQAAAVTKGK